MQDGHWPSPVVDLMSLLFLCIASILCLSVNAFLRDGLASTATLFLPGTAFFHSFVHWRGFFFGRFFSARFFQMYSHTNSISWSPVHILVTLYRWSFVRCYFFGRCWLVIGRRSPRNESSSHHGGEWTFTNLFDNYILTLSRQISIIYVFILFIPLVITF